MSRLVSGQTRPGLSEAVRLIRLNRADRFHLRAELCLNSSPKSDRERFIKEYKRKLHKSLDLQAFRSYIISRNHK